MPLPLPGPGPGVDLVVKYEQNPPENIEKTFIGVDNKNEEVTVFRETTSSPPDPNREHVTTPPAPAPVTNNGAKKKRKSRKKKKRNNNNESDRNSADVKNTCGSGDSVSHDVSNNIENNDYDDEDIPLSQCFLSITKILETYKMPSSIVKVSVTHKKIIQFLTTVLTSNTASRDYVIATLNSYPHYLDIFSSNHLFTSKLFGFFKSEALSENHKTVHSNVVVRNVMCLLYKIQEFVLRELKRDVSSSEDDLDRWDSSEPGYDFLNCFTKGMGTNLSGASTAAWFISNIQNRDAAEFFLQLIVDFHNNAEFTVMINRWLVEEYIVIELMEAMGDIEASHDNIAFVLLGMLDLIRSSSSSRKKGHRAVAMLSDHLFSPTTVNCLSASLLSLLSINSQTLTPNERYTRTNGIKRGFEILSGLLHFDQRDEKGDVRLFCNRNKKVKNKGFWNQRNNIKSVLSNGVLINALHKNLEEHVPGPGDYVKLTSCGTVAFGITRRYVLGFIHDLVLRADKAGLLALLKYEQIFLFLLKHLFWLHPLNTFIHLKICSIATVLLKSGIIEAAEMFILRSNFITASLQFLKIAKPRSKGQQKAYIMKIMKTLVDCTFSNTSSAVKDALRKWIEANPQLKSEWEQFVLVDLPAYLRIQKIVLGGVPKPVKDVDSGNKSKSSRPSSSASEDPDEDDDYSMTSDSD